MKNILVLITLLLVKFTFSQFNIDTLNKFNKKNNKQGYWLYYFNDTLCMVKEKKDAYFYTLMYFDNGYSFDGFFCNNACKGRKRCVKFERISENTTKGNPILLNGTFNYYDKAGNLYMSDTYLNGIPTIVQGLYYNDKGICTEKVVYNYSKKYENQTCSFYMETYKSGVLKESSYYAKNKKGKWRFIKQK